MTFHLHGNLITNLGIASNNRGEGQGNRSDLPKIFWKGKPHVTVSAEAIRFALRQFWLCEGLENHRVWDEENLVSVYAEERDFDPQKYIDDDVCGFMKAEAGKRKKGENSAEKRRGALDVSRAVSLEDATKITYTFNSSSFPKEGNSNSLYSTECISTRFQYGFSITPERLVVPERLIDVLAGLLKLHNVGGNHGRFLYDFSPESLILRWSHFPASQILLTFECDRDDNLSAPAVVRRVKCEDIPASELWIFGGYAFTEEARELEGLGCHVYPSVRMGSQALLNQICRDLSLSVDHYEQKLA